MINQRQGKGFLCSEVSGKCLYPVPVLTVDDLLILHLIDAANTQWDHVGTMSYERRTRLPFSAVKDAAEHIGVTLSRERWRKIKLCISALINDDLAAIKASQSKEDNG